MTKTDEQIKKPTAQKILNVQQILKNHTYFKTVHLGELSF